MIAEAPGQTTVRVHPYQDDETPRAPVHRPGANDINTRLEELTELHEDWDGYGARPIDRHAAWFALRVITLTTSHGLPAPEIFPVPSGGVQLEWTSSLMELEFEIEPGGRSVVFVGDDTRSGRHFDGVLPRDQSLFRQALANLVSGLGERRPS